ncbi:MAG TPA: SGNH/GDSL hydrolase family protein [Cytophagaceae bacterium]
MKNNQSPLTYLALGDSYTIGEGVEQVHSFPFQLTLRLRQKGLPVEFPEVVATTGWTTGELLNALEKKKLDTKFNIVTLLIGVNNQYRGYSKEQYREEFFTLVRKAIAYSLHGASHVFVLSIPDWGVTPFAEGRDRDVIRREINEFNQINWEEASRAGVNYTDITAISRQVPLYPSWLTHDQLHPSGEMYEQWVEKLLPLVLKSVEQ